MTNLIAALLSLFLTPDHPGPFYHLQTIIMQDDAVIASPAVRMRSDMPVSLVAEQPSAYELHAEVHEGVGDLRRVDIRYRVLDGAEWVDRYEGTHLLDISEAATVDIDAGEGLRLRIWLTYTPAVTGQI